MPLLCYAAMPAFHWPAAAHDDTDRRIRSLELEQHVMQRSSISACAAPLSFVCFPPAKEELM
jgi:hypothetical protein